MAEGEMEDVGVGVPAPFWTFTFIAVVAINALALLYPLTASVCCPFATAVEFQLILKGGDDAI